jgi:Ca2+-binding RTX toxin-like protein
VCNPDKQFPGQTPQIKPCPTGSDFNLTTGNCVITASSGNPSIVVGKPFQGPSGGTVVPLGTARKRYKSPCLTGPGPQYVVVGTNKRDRITGTNKADRILGLGGNDALDGGRGNDCVEGGKGGDNISGALGSDRLYGLSGADHLNGGPGNDRLSAGSGNDTINAAYGRDLAIGGPGRDYINVATAGPPATVRCGAGFDKVRINQKERKRISGCEVNYVFKDR